MIKKILLQRQIDETKKAMNKNYILSIVKTGIDDLAHYARIDHAVGQSLIDNALRRISLINDL